MDRHDDVADCRETRDDGVMFLVNSLQVGGSERKAVRLANALAARSRKVVLAYLNHPESLLAQVHPAVATTCLERRGKFSTGALRRLSTVIEEHRVATLVAVNLYPALYAVLAKALCIRHPLRVVASVNTTEFATAKEKLQMLLYRHVLRRADLVAFGAEYQRRLWSSRYGTGQTPGRNFVLYNAIDTVEFSKANVVPARIGGLGDCRVILGTVGALRIEKAQIDLVRVVHELAGRGVDAGAIIVGDGPQRPGIEREIQRLGVEQRVCLVGEVRDVRPYLAAMDVFVLPSTVETFSNAVLEAMAMSCPVVASRVGGMEEMLQFGGGRTYSPRNVESLCDALMPLMLDVSARKQLGEQAREAVEQNFSFERMINDFGRHVLQTGGRVSLVDA